MLAPGMCIHRITLALGLVYAGAALSAPGLPLAGYDEALCITAQRILVNAPDIPVRVQRGEGNGFHTIQMSVDAQAGSLVVAMTTATARIDGRSMDTAVACKMVNRERVNDQLGLALDGPRRSCRDINEHTWQVAWNSLSDAERARYERDGRRLEFLPDAVLASGGEWLPANANGFVTDSADRIAVAAPTVRVPWNASEREFFQGTQHCKLLTLAALKRWLTEASFLSAASLLPPTRQACRGPAIGQAAAGSCLFYFAPVDRMFCEDYNGARWTADSAREACARRHASKAALQAADNRYTGAGGLYAELNCASRDDRPAITGTCVFNCGLPDETLWQVSGPDNGMMNRACDLYLPGRTDALR
jgi:hypothetical protein